MRVVAGTWGGRRLRAPAGVRTRPTSARVREALFSSLGPLEGVRALDLFAGSGALGLEARSRGAAEVTLVERERRALVALRANVADLAGPGEAVRVVAADALVHLRDAAGAGEAYDLAFLDPPYRDAATLAATLRTLLPAVLAPGAVVVVEADRRAVVDLDLPVERERRYGDTVLRLHRA